MTKKSNTFKWSFLKNLVDSFLEIFRKKEFYEIDYDELNTYSIEFEFFDEIVRQKIKDVILNFHETSKIEDSLANLKIQDSIKYDNIDLLLNEIEIIVSTDYKKTYFESKQNNWNFNYFLSYPDKIFENVLFITNRIKKKDVDSSIFYSLLAIKKDKKSFYLWNMLDDYDYLDD